MFQKMPSISLSFFTKLNHTDLLVEIRGPKYRYYKTDLAIIAKRGLRIVNLLAPECGYLLFLSPILVCNYISYMYIVYLHLLFLMLVNDVMCLPSEVLTTF